MSAHALPLSSRPEVTTARPRASEGVLPPLFGLLRYVGRHRGYAAVTIAFGVLGFLLSFAYPWIIGAVVDTLAVSRGHASGAELTRIHHLAELGLLTALGHAAVVYGRGHFNVHLGHSIVADIRLALFRHLQRLSVGFFTKKRTGTIVSRVLHDVHDATALVYTGVIVAVLDAVQLAVAVVLLCSVSWKLTAACLALFPLYGCVFATMNPRVRAASERMQAAFGRISGTLSERLAGQALVKTYTAEARETEQFARELRGHHGLVVTQSHHGHVVASLGEVLVHLGTTTVIGYGGYLALRGEITPGQLTRFLGYAMIMFGPVRRFAELNITYQSSLSSIRRVFRILELEPRIVEVARPRRQPPALGHVVFERVGFRYDEEVDEGADLGDDDEASTRRGGTAPWVLQDVSFEAKPGERVAVVGPSGAGKTSLVSLVPRLYDVTRGRILLDGTDVRDYALDALRSSIAVVQQDSFVFSGSIRDNIAYGRPDATDAEIEEAARAANAHEFIVRLADGYDTKLGERGVNLSGGQRQRISIARAVLKDPRILVLDEATSSLDAENEAIVQEALDRLMRARTSLVVAHRLSTIRNADRIVVLDHGRVMEVGKHDELRRAGGIYERLVRRQT